MLSFSFYFFQQISFTISSGWIHIAKICNFKINILQLYF
ncbi:hypothetical protein W04_1295 [Pseudoalteromonas sp. SW0106-04]|nr:hypothetical protein W04_1295 [Pseudoalteromonas sp. SW0106-04]